MPGTGEDLGHPVPPAGVRMGVITTVLRLCTAEPAHTLGASTSMPGRGALLEMPAQARLTAAKHWPTVEQGLCFGNYFAATRMTG